MEVLQVKQYHQEVAGPKQQEALKRWKQKDNGYGYPIKSMFYFMLTDKQGYCNNERQKGYIIYNETTALFIMSKAQAYQQAL